MSLKLVTFDVTNTLLRVAGSPSLQYARAGRQLGLDVTEAQISSLYGVTWRQVRNEYPVYGRKQGLSSKEFWGIFIHRVFTNAGFGHERRLLGELATKLYTQFQSAENWTLLPHSHETLAWVKGQGLQLGVVSNLDERLPVILENHNLREFFDFFVTSVAVGAEKPSARMFEAALTTAAVQPAQAVHVGDDVINDYLSARAVGMRALLVRRPGDPPGVHAPPAEQEGHLAHLDPSHVVADLRELQAALRQLNES